MANPKTDPNGLSNSGPDEERDLGAKGGPTTGLGRPDDKHEISAPYDSDTATQMAAKSKKKDDKKKEDRH